MQNEVELHTGSIKYYNSTRGFGFIRDDLGPEYFYHASGLINGFVPAEGERIQFIVGENKGKPIAKEVTKI
jgi:cold shock protein